MKQLNIKIQPIPNRVINVNYNTIIGLRADNILVSLTNDNNRVNIPIADEREFMLYNPNNQKIIAELEQLRTIEIEQKKEIISKRNQLISQLEITDLQTFKNKLL